MNEKNTITDLVRYTVLSEADSPSDASWAAPSSSSLSTSATGGLVLLRFGGGGEKRLLMRLLSSRGWAFDSVGISSSSLKGCF